MKILTPWPGCMKRIINGNKEWKKYWDESNNFRMFDLATINKQNIFIHGRVDDVINIRGHRIGSSRVGKLTYLFSNFGSFAFPKKIYYISELPKTRSGKILRRLLRSILENPLAKNYGDISTILNKEIIYEIKEKILQNEKNKFRRNNFNCFKKYWNF